MRPDDQRKDQTEREEREKRRITGRLMGQINASPFLGITDTLPSGPIQLRFEVVPHDPRRHTFNDSAGRRWRILIVPIGMTAGWIPMEVMGDVIIGSNADPGADLDLNLNAYDGWARGVSRRHAMLRPSANKLFIMDLRSTNGTLINGQPLGIGWAYALKDNDLISLAKLHLRVRIIQKPTDSA